MSIVVRYLKGKTLTKQRIDVINQSNLKDKALADTTWSHLKSLNLEKMIGLGYDEASFMFRKKKRRSCNCKRVAFHFSANVLNLVVVKPYAVPKNHGAIDFIRDIASFLNQAVKEMHD